MGLNAKTKRKIKEGAEFLKEVIAARGALSCTAAKTALRENETYQRVEDVTIGYIGEHGAEQNWYCFDTNRGFWPLGYPQPAGFMRDHVYQWALETVPKNDRLKVRDRISAILDDFDDPTVDMEAHRIAQQLNERRDLDSKELGSFVSFVLWGIENGKLRGDRRLLRPPDDMVQDGLVHGNVSAKIVPLSITNTQDQWMWWVNHVNGQTSTEWWSIPQMGTKLKQLANESVDELDVDELDLLGVVPDTMAWRDGMQEPLPEVPEGYVAVRRTQLEALRDLVNALLVE